MWCLRYCHVMHVGICIGILHGIPVTRDKFKMLIYCILKLRWMYTFVSFSLSILDDIAMAI